MSGLFTSDDVVVEMEGGDALRTPSATALSVLIWSGYA